MRGFGSVVQTHLNEHDSRISKNSKLIAELQKEVHDLNEKVGVVQSSSNQHQHPSFIADFDKRVQLIKQQIMEEVKEENQASSSVDVPTVSLPYEQRTIARIGNLGWDQTSETLTERARRVLVEAAVPADHFSGLCPIVNRAGKGSLVELVFSSAVFLQHARLSVRARQLKIDGDRIVWLDARKEREELKPARIVHRICECLEDFEQACDNPLPVQKFMNGKFVKVGGTRAGYVFKSSWHWTQWSKTRYDSDQLAMACA